MADRMLSVLAGKLRHLAADASAIEAVLQAVSAMRTVKARQEVLHEGERSQQVLVVLDGLVDRHKTLRDGQRQIVSFGIAGDFCNSQTLVAPVLDFGVRTLTDCTFAVLPERNLRELVDHHPKLALALWRESVAEAAVEREWVLNLGRRPAPDRMAHMLCEMDWRTANAGLAQGESYHFPLTQMELGEALGLSTVHVNRVLQDLRARGLIRFRQGMVTVVRSASLRFLAGFDPRYLAAEPV